MKIGNARSAAIAGAIAIICGGAGAAVAAVQASTIAGRTVGPVKLVRSAVDSSTTSTAWVAVPGASTTINVPSASSAAILARFSGNSECLGNLSGNPCRLRIVVDGAEAQPSSLVANIFDTVPWAQPDVPEAHSTERSRAVSPGSSHTVTVQWRTDNSSTTFYLASWHLTVEVVKS